MRRTTLLLIMSAALAGCVVREVYHVRDPGPTCPACGEQTEIPGAMVADSQPPSPLTESMGEPPGVDYSWIDGYWHWNGAEWIWIGGQWVAPMDGFVFIAPSYYTSGSECVYVPGRWQRGDGRVVRDHRSERERQVVRDHRGHGAKGEWPVKPARDHRGERPRDLGTPGDGGGDRGETVTWTVRTRPNHQRPRGAADEVRDHRGNDDVRDNRDDDGGGDAIWLGPPPVRASESAAPTVVDPVTPGAGATAWNPPAPATPAAPIRPTWSPPATFAPPAAARPSAPPPARPAWTPPARSWSAPERVSAPAPARTAGPQPASSRPSSPPPASRPSSPPPSAGRPSAPPPSSRRR